MARMRVVPSGPVACMVFYRQDGHELSLSSMGNSFVEFHGSVEVASHGPCYSVEEFLQVVSEFIKEE